MASIKKDPKTNKWYCRVSYKDKHGKYKTKTRMGFNTKAEATVVANQLELSDDIEADTANTPLSDYFKKWIETYKEGMVSDEVYKRYEFIHQFIDDYFGKKPMQSITHMEYQAMINERGKNRGKDTVKKTNSAIRSCVMDAMADGLIKKDFTRRVKLSFENKSSGRVKYWDHDEYLKLINHFKSSLDVKDFMLYTIAVTGLRIGEAYGIGDDITKSTLSVNRGYNYRTTMNFTEGKTTSSIRTIKTFPELYTRMSRYRLANGKVNDTYLFLDEYNNPMISHTALQNYLKKTCCNLGIKELTIHCLRHTHCSELIYQGLDILYISKRLGHKNVDETIRTYSHILDEYNQVQEEKIKEFYDVVK